MNYDATELICGYRPLQAGHMASERLHKPRGGKQVHLSTWKTAKGMLMLQSSPEQAAGRCKAQGLGDISHETFYKSIYQDKANGATLHKYLRCNKKRRKRYGSKRTRRGRIPNRRGIEHRCAQVEDRATVGHWEGDLVIGKNQRGALVTLVERKSGFGIVRQVKRKQADLVAEKIIEALLPLRTLVKTITFDNGLEFAKHEMIAKALDAPSYFADPYSSWQRGTNENWNGLLRQYFPKKCRFEAITPEQVAKAQGRLNNQPRRRLFFSSRSRYSRPQQNVAVLRSRVEIASSTSAGFIARASVPAQDVVKASTHWAAEK